jgi:thiamine-phosphate pyrophosphorylase
MVSVTEAKLYIVVAASIDPRSLQALVATGEVAAVLIAPASGDAAPEPSKLKSLVELAQSHGVAALIAADASLARTLRADGVHLPWSKDILARYREARDLLGGRYIVGADAGRLRDDAMTLGEEGADYVGFGIPPHVEDRDTARERRAELVSWWSEIFEIPCVAVDVETADIAASLVAAGADFVSLALPPGADPAAWIGETAAVLSRSREGVA